jgi:hypothetical protein
MWLYRLRHRLAKEAWIFMPSVKHLVAFSLLAALALTGTAAAASISLVPPTLTSNSHLICPNGKLNPGGLMIYYYANDKVAEAFPEGLDDLKAALKAPGSQKATRAVIVSEILGLTYEMLIAEKGGFQLAPPTQDPDAEAFLAGTAGIVVTCTKSAVAKPAAPVKPAPVPPETIPAPTAAVPTAPGTDTANNETPPPPWYNNFRIRGTSDALLVSPESTADFAAATGATLSLTQNGPTKTTANALQVAIGYDYQYIKSKQTQFDVIPFIGVDRSITDVSGKQSSSSRENVMAGLVGSMRNIVPGAASVLSGTYEHLWNDIDTSQLNFIHFVEQPVIPPYINAYGFFPRGASLDKSVGVSLLVDLRGDIGLYDDRGLNPATTHDYQQFGTNFGVAIAIQPIESNISVTETYRAETEHYRKNISYFNVGWTYNIAKNFGIKASYQNGNLETTAQRIEQWLISLNLKY